MNITVYSTPYCGFCDRLKRYLHEKKIEFTEVNVADDPNQASYIIKLTGQAGVPVLIKQEEGKEPQFTVGFNQAKVDALLGI